MPKTPSIETVIAIMGKDIKDVKDTTLSIESKLERDYVTQDQLRLVVNDVSLIKKIVFGAIGLAAIAVATALINSIIKK